jgi:hypothetical protein
MEQPVSFSEPADADGEIRHPIDPELVAGREVVLDPVDARLSGWARRMIFMKVSVLAASRVGRSRALR